MTVIENDSPKEFFEGPFEVSDLIPFTFPYTDRTDVKVKIGDEAATYGVEYEISAESPSSILVKVNIDSGVQVTVYRETPIDQQSSYPQNSKFRSEQVESDFDKVCMIQQEQKEMLARCLRVPVENIVAFDGELPSPQEGKILVWSDEGKIVNSPSTITEIEDSVDTAVSNAATALSSASEAVLTAESAEQKATTALNQSTTALNNSTAAVTSAESAVSTANSASAAAASAVEAATYASNKVDDFGEDIETVIEAAERIDELEEAIDEALEAADTAEQAAAQATEAAEEAVQALSTKQDVLVSGTNIKTVNSTSLLGSGNIDVGTVTSVNNVQPVNGNVTLDLSSRNIGEIVTSTIPLTDAGLHLLDGALIQYGSYGAFVDYIADLYTENPNASYFAKTEMDWAQPVLSSNGTLGGNSFAVSASSVYSSTYETYLAFDNSDSTQWLSQQPASVAFPVTLTLYNPVALKCSKLTMTNRLTYSSIFTGGNVYGSDDNSTWNLITAFTNNVTTAGAQWEINLSSNNNFYKYYKIEFTSGVVDSGTTNASYGFTEVKLSATYQVTAEEWWQNQVNTYGVCGKFVYDSVNNTVRLPKITGIIEGTTDITALDDLVEAGLPNIVGAGGVNFDTTQGSEVGGAFYTSASSGKVASNTSGTYLAYRTNMDASRYNSIYGNSTTVQPQAIKVLYYIVIATSTKTDIQVDIDEIATDLNGKADVDLSNITNTAKYIFDGQWVNASTSMINTATTFSGATTREYSLANYLPNDGYNYEVIVAAIGETGSTSGNTAEISIGSSFVDYMANRVAFSVTRTSNTANWGWCGVIPIGTDRKIYIRQIHSSSCTCRYFRCKAYRRIGSNS